MPQLRSLNEPSIMRKALRSPATWLGILLLFVALAVADSFRPPSRQASVRLFTAAVACYHHYLHPVTGRWIHCRFEPTCSRYSVEAVQK
jgi:hypothetical protein